MAALTADIRLIVGLGNPGADYVDTRHNAGFWLVDLLAQDRGLNFRFEKRYNAEECKFKAAERDVFLLKPQTFMNRSGQSVAGLARFYKIAPEQILVLHDELDLPPGTNRIKQAGGHGGHNGLRDIINHLGSREFFRIRIGIGHPGDSSQVINYVLHKPSATDLKAIEAANLDTLEVMPLVIEGRIDKAMQALHS
ncbi:MAG: aminoacyl-tRNA hydrolase [Gammaproteobacteria bacterium]|nr:aminoacyl-tRNA hydrolase [Gammaproteobacteria bacterium]MDH3446549.1 aminoacyl-tRNA hydrolase [Gammaproteobacteria bacterium]